MPYLSSRDKRGQLNPRARNEWPADRVAELTELVTAGVTFVEIGRRMGITKNAALGKAKRIEVESPNATGPRSPSCTTMTQRLDALEAMIPGAGCCRYINGDLGKPGYGFCGAPVERIGEAWCREHRMRVYREAGE